MKKFLVLIIIVINYFNVQCQKIEIQGCMANTISPDVISSPYTSKGFSFWDLNIIQLGYFHKIRENCAIGIRGSFYDPMVLMEFKRIPEMSGIGYTMGSFFNLTLLSQFRYLLLPKMKMNLYFGVNNSYYKAYQGLNINSDISNSNFKYKDEIKSYSGFQFRPEFSLGIEWLFLKFFSIEFKTAYIQGTRKIQEIEAKYSFKGEQEYFAKNYSRGSMLNFSFSMYFYFGGYNK